MGARGSIDRRRQLDEAHLSPADGDPCRGIRAKAFRHPSAGADRPDCVPGADATDALRRDRRLPGIQHALGRRLMRDLLLARRLFEEALDPGTGSSDPEAAGELAELTARLDVPSGRTFRIESFEGVRPADFSPQAWLA